MEKDLPKGWSLSTIEDSTEILDNKRKPVSASERAKRIGDIPYYGATGIAGSIDDFIFDEELVLLGEDGAPFLDLGKNVAYLIEGKSWVNNHAHVLKAKLGISSNQFLLHYLNQFDYTDYVGGTTRLKLNQGNLKKIPFPIPPLAEQKRIVAKLDTLFASLENTKTRLAKIPALLKNFKQAVLTQAVTGKLTEAWREGKELESGTSIIQKILEERRDYYNHAVNDANRSKTKKPKKAKLDGFEDLKFGITLPEKWCYTSLEQIAAKKPNALKAGPFGSALKKEFYKPTGYKIYGQEQVIKGDIHYGDYYVGQDKFKELESCRIDSGDILISLVGTIGKVLVVPDEFEPGIINPRLLKLSLHERISQFYFGLYLKSSLVQSYFKGDANGSTMDVLNLRILKSLPIILPPEAEQQEIVRRVESLFAKADAIEVQYSKLKQKIDTLPQALLAKAFRGELVAQNPLDEPASVLLEKIKAEKDKLATKPKRKNNHI